MTAPVIPVSSVELNEMLLDKKVMDVVYQTPETFKEFLTNYAKAANSVAHGDIERIVDERLQAGLASFAENTKSDIRRPDLSKAGIEDIKRNRQTGAAYNKLAMGTAIDGEFTDIADVFNTINHRADRTEPERRARIEKMKNALSSSVPSEGGFLIPEEFRSEMLALSLETAVVRPRARVIPMSSRTLAMPVNDSTTNATSNFGGIVAYWAEESSTLVASTPTFGQIVLDAKKLTAYADLPNELSDDAAALQAFLNMAYPEAMSFAEDAAFLMGDGSGQPLGALSTQNPAIVVASAVNGAESTITWTNVVNMYARMLPGSLNRAVWVVSPDTFPQLALMTAPNGSAFGPIWIKDAHDSPVLTLLGRPVVISEKVSTLGAQGDISFVDFGYYLIGDRMAMSAATSAHYKFANDITSYRLIERVDGRPWLLNAITPKNGGPTLSPFVQLEGTGLRTA
jgi:HK97 family phage major capsid protein